MSLQFILKSHGWNLQGGGGGGGWGGGGVGVGVGWGGGVGVGWGWGWGVDVSHDDVIKWKHFPRYWPFVRGIHRSPVNSPHKGQWRGALMFSLICAWINDWVSNREAGDLRRHRAHYDVIVMYTYMCTFDILPLDIIKSIWQQSFYQSQVLNCQQWWCPKYLSTARYWLNNAICLSDK